MVTRKEAFRQAYTNLDLSPLLEPWALERFRVDYGDEVLAELEQMVEDDEAEDGKTIFSGHRGCGKSTLLAEFGRQCEQPEKVRIDRAVFEQAVKEIRLDFEAPLGRVDYEILQQVYKNFEPADPKDQTFLDLLHSLHVLEYRNGKIWYDLHPIVKDLLVLKGMVKG
ncbi:MAG: hypothetical protein WA885_16755 [Phormidesmis sp.]